MRGNRNRKLIIPTLVVLSFGVVALAWADGFLGGLHDVWGPSYTYGGTPAPQLLSSPRSPRVLGDDANAILYWNEVMTDANAIDHTPPAAGEPRVFGEQLGPARTALAFAIVHIAIFDAVNAIV